MSDWTRASFTDVSDAAQLAALNAQLAYAASRSPYYREALAPLGTLRSLDELRRAPFLTAEKLKTKENTWLY